MTLLLQGKISVPLRRLFVLIATPVFFFCFAVVVFGKTVDEETMLMFVGESKPVVTVASRYPESPTTAPAIVTVIGRDKIERYGYRTLAELLASQPGFYLSASGRGTVPYLRGQRDSVLFLFDGVPITTDVTKSFAALDSEMSLSSVERVEIIRGVGSVLWGADAFSGVVNIVPRRGRSAPGMTTSLTAGNEELRSANVSIGNRGDGWDSFLSLTGTREAYQGLGRAEPYNADVMPDYPDPSSYTELVGTLNIRNWLHLSGRWSNDERHFMMQNGLGDIRWSGTKKAPFNYLKAVISRVVGPGHMNLTTYYQQTDYRLQDADSERRQKNHVFYLEGLWDRRIMTQGLITLGASWRQNAVTGAVIKDGFLPDFLNPDEAFFEPQISQENFTNDQLSLFGQLRYLWKNYQFWAGLRMDDHSQYTPSFSYSFGLQRAYKNYSLKASYGNAYRSPYSSQLFSGEKFDSESIKTGSAQLAWSKNDSRLELTLFHSRVSNHRNEDPYGGLSLPSRWSVYGLELSGDIPINDQLIFNCGLSLLNSHDVLESYRVLAYSFVRPDRSRVDIFDTWDAPLSQGPNWQIVAGLHWQIAAGQSLEVSGHLGGDSSYSYNKGTIQGRYSSPLLIDLSYRCPGLFTKDKFLLRITNLLDREYTQPDIYGPIGGDPMQVSVLWELRY